MAFLNAIAKMKAYLLMVFLQFGYAGMFVISVASLKSGMNHYVLVVYRNATAVVVILPFALYFESKVRPRMTWIVFIKIAALALLEPVLDQNLYYMGAKLTSASFASALYNILPAITFVMAIVLRIEKIKIKSRRSQAKIVGTIVTVAGAVLMILYKGPVVDFVWSKGRSHHSAAADQSAAGNWLMGTVMLLGSCFSWAAFYIVQANTLAAYPAELSLTALICFMGAAMSSVVTLVAEGFSPKPWAIGFDMRLITAVYSGVMCSGVAYYVQGLVMKERGPVFVTAFNPLCMIITAVLGSIILAEEITLGSIIGAIIIVIGLYSLIWGKSKDYQLQSDQQTNTAGTSKGVQLPVTTHEGGNSGSSNHRADGGLPHHAAIKVEH